MSECLQQTRNLFFYGYLASYTNWILLVRMSVGNTSICSAVASAPSPARGPVNQVYALAWAPDGIRLALGAKNGDIQVWNTKSQPVLLAARQRFGEVFVLVCQLVKPIEAQKAANSCRSQLCSKFL